MQVNTSDLKGAALDWAVAKAEGVLDDYRIDVHLDLVKKDLGMFSREEPGALYSPTAVWAQGGEIIEREGIALRQHNLSGTWYAMLSNHLGDTTSPAWARHNYLVTKHGETPKQLRFDAGFPLVAAMRCYVASKLGDTVDVPDKLIQGTNP